MPSPADYVITTSGADYVPQASALHGETFKTDPVINYMLNRLPFAERQAYTPVWMSQLIYAGGLNGGIFSEIDDFASSTVCIPPGRSLDNLRTYWSAGLHRMMFKLGITGIKKMLWDFQRQADQAKKQGLAARGWTRFYYIFFISTRKERRGQGLGAILIEKIQKQAESEDLPVWLEATTEGSMRLYRRLGFETISEIVLGKGIANREGNVEKGGSGVSIWAMIWEPHSSNKASSPGGHDGPLSSEN